MGKARVTDNLGEGQYDFELIYSDERAQARIDFLNEIIGLNEDLQLVKLQADLAVAQAEVNVQADKVDAAIADWVGAGTWTADTDYSIGDRVRINGLATILCEQSGRSGSIVPVWPEKHGETIRENYVIWSASLSETSTTNRSANTDYVADDEVTLAINFEFVIDNPETGGGHFEHLNGTATRDGRSGNFEPSWIKGENIDGGVIWRREDRLQAIVEANKELLERRVKRDKAAADVQVLKVYILSWKREKAFIERHLPAQVLKVAGWCADYSPDIPIDTEVETAEVTGFHHGGLTSAGKATDRTVLIRPQEAPADYPPSILTPAGDVVQLSEVPAGKLRHAVACTAAECLYALMIEPGAEKWRPTWRIGIIDSIDKDADTCSVTLLFADAPRYSDLQVQNNINETVILNDVPIRYMSCNAEAFEVGDRVLIEYAGQDRSFPTVRGFEKNPRICPVISGIICDPHGGGLNQDYPHVILEWRNDAWRRRDAGTSQELTGTYKEVFDSTNSYRLSIGLTPFLLPRRGYNPAQIHADNMAATGIFAHDSEEFPEGQQTFLERIEPLGANSGYGENIAQQTVSFPADGAKVVQEWIDSPEHHQNIAGFNFSTQINRTGLYVGIAEDSDWRYYVQAFFTYVFPGNYGNMDWRGAYVDGKPTKVISYAGTKMRHFFYSLRNYNGFVEDPLDLEEHSLIIYRSNKVLSTVPTNYIVRGAALTMVNNQEWVIAICETNRQHNRISYVIKRPSSGDSTSAWYDPDTAPNGWELIGQWEPTDNGGRRSWFFDGTGRKALNVRRSGAIALMTINVEANSLLVQLDPASVQPPAGAQLVFGADWKDQTVVHAYFTGGGVNTEEGDDPQVFKVKTKTYTFSRDRKIHSGQAVETWVSYSGSYTITVDWTDPLVAMQDHKWIETGIKSEDVVWNVDPRMDHILLMGSAIDIDEEWQTNSYWKFDPFFQFSHADPPHEAQVNYRIFLKYQNVNNDFQTGSIFEDLIAVTGKNNPYTEKVFLNMMRAHDDAQIATELGGRSMISAMASFEDPYPLRGITMPANQRPKRQFNWLEDGDPDGATGTVGPDPRYRPLGIV